jgi:hypothetical protein
MDTTSTLNLNFTTGIAQEHLHGLSDSVGEILVLTPKPKEFAPVEVPRLTQPEVNATSTYG